MELSDEDTAKIANAVAHEVGKGLLPGIQEWFLREQKLKFERVLDIDNCDDPEQRRRVRETIQFGHQAREWVKSAEGKAALDSLDKLAKLLATDEGTDKLRTLERLADNLNNTENWVKSRLLQAVAIGLLMVAYIGFQSWDSIKRLIPHP